MIALLLILLAGPPLRPDPQLTPGRVATTNTRTVCTAGYAAAHRHVTLKTKLGIYKAYGLAPSGRWLTLGTTRTWQSDFEVDHLVSLQLGGSNAPENLWVQSYRTVTYNATSKDALENRLHWLVCHGQLALVEAQRTIRVDWIAAYRLFVQ